MSDVPARYSAFISYARDDERAARWLQRCIEGYRLPRNLRGDGPGRLPPVFRDRDELSAGADLEAALRTALNESAWLIVVCTPAAAASKWVAREVAMFRALHGPDCILTALFDGEPDTAFADILRSADGEAPLAADFRTHGDGRKLGSLKLIARLAGVRLDDLVHRDAARRARRFGFAAVAAALLAVAMAALALVAVRAQAAAEIQRNKAEGLVEFMLTDLRKRLKGVGKLDLLTAVNKRALAYYDGMDLARLPPDSLERRAGLLHAMGEDDEKRGNLALAIRQWEEARRTTAALLAAAPDDAERVFAHSQSEFWVGFAAWREGDLPKAKTAFLAYARLTARLRRLEPDNLDYAMEQGYALSNLGVFTLRPLGQAAAAETLFQKSLAAFQSVARRRPADINLAKDVGDAWGWLADTQRLQDRFELARAYRREQRRILDRLSVRDATDIDLRARLVGNAIAVARIEIAAGRFGTAGKLLEGVKDEAWAIARNDPADADALEMARMVDLLRAQSALSAGRSNNDLLGLTRFCAGRRPNIADEITSFCGVLRYRVAQRLGQKDIVPPEVPRSLLVGRYTRRWGLDLRTETLLAPTSAEKLS